VNNAIWLSGEPVSVVDLPYWPNNSCFFSGVKYIVFKVLWCASFSFPEDYAPGSTLRQIILTLDSARACGKYTLFFTNYKTFFKEKEKIYLFGLQSGGFNRQFCPKDLTTFIPTNPCIDI
jgi:hypothetical protein